MVSVTNKKIKKEEFLKIESELTDDGILMKVKNRQYRIQYPKDVWQSYPETNRELLLDNLTFMQTCHLPQTHKKKGAVYSTAMPLFETFAFKSFLYDIPSTAIIDNVKTTDYMRDFFNMKFIFSSYDPIIPEIEHKKKASSKKKPTAVILFTGGKESLLTLGLCLELGITPIPVFLVEREDHPETAHKEKLIKALRQEYGIEVQKLLSEPGKLRFCEFGEDENNLGAGTQFLTYAMEVLPFAEYYNADYIFFGNEHSCDDSSVDPEGFEANFCYDQTSSWTRQLTSVAGTMTGGRVEVGSLVANLYEFGIVKILHQRYPLLAKLQMSCFSDADKGNENRWCGNCPKCANMYAFFKALGVDTKRMGFRSDMFQPESKPFFPIFEDGTYSYELSGIVAEEQALALYMAAENGAKGPLIDEFRNSQWFTHIKGNFQRTKNKFFAIHENIAIPYELKEKVMDLFDETLQDNFVPKDLRLKHVIDAAKDTVDISQPLIDEQVKQ